MFTFDVFWGSLGTSTLETQVHPQIILDPDYLSAYFTLSYDNDWTRQPVSHGWKFCVANVSFSVKPQLEDTMSIYWISFGKSANWFNILSPCVKTGTFSAKICKACLG